MADQKAGKQIKLEIRARVEHSSKTASGLRIVESGILFNDNQGPFFKEPGTPDELGTMIALGLAAQAVVTLIKNAEHIGLSKTDDRDRMIESVVSKIVEGLIMTDGLKTGKIEDI